MVDRLTFAFGQFVIFTSQVGVQYCCTSTNGTSWINRIFPDLTLINSLNPIRYYDYGHFGFNNGTLTITVNYGRRDADPYYGIPASSTNINAILTTRDCVTWERSGAIFDTASNGTLINCILLEPLLDDVYAVSYFNSTVYASKISYNRGLMTHADLSNTQNYTYPLAPIKDGTTPFCITYIRNFGGIAIGFGGGVTGKVIAVSYDQCKSWVKSLSTTLTLPALQYGSYLSGTGNSKMVTSIIGNRMFINNNTASSTMATLDIDSAKFHTPVIPGAYIKVT
jgi:hypothetical protein